MGKKKKYVGIKGLIRRTFEKACKEKGIEATISTREYKDGTWHCTWRAYLDIPEGFDASIRDSAREEILPYVEQKYREIIAIAKECFGIIRFCPYRDEKWYDFTVPFPPMHVAVGEQWDHVDGEFKKIKDARLLTEEELTKRLRFYEEEGKTNSIFASFAKQMKWEMENWKKYFRFVGGSPYEDELFEATHYNGIQIHGSFEFDAFGNYIPLQERLGDVHVSTITSKVFVRLGDSGEVFVPMEELNREEHLTIPLKCISKELEQRYGRQLRSIRVFTEEELMGYIYQYDRIKWREYGRISLSALA